MIVRVSREGVEIVGDDVRYTSGSLLTFVPERGKALILRVGGTEEEVRAALLSSRLEGSLPAAFRIVLPGGDPWWDAQYAWPLRKTELPAPADDSEALLLNPLSVVGWSPPAISALLRYALFSSSPKAMRWLRWPFTRPKLSLEYVGDFTSVERAELLDAADDAWGASHVLAPPGVSRLRRSPWQLVWWTGLVAMIATTLYSVSHQWPLWQRIVVTLAALSPAFIAKRRLDQLSWAAPRRSAAQQAVEADRGASS